MYCVLLKKIVFYEMVFICEIHVHVVDRHTFFFIPVVEIFSFVYRLLFKGAGWITSYNYQSGQLKIF